MIEFCCQNIVKRDGDATARIRLLPFRSNLTLMQKFYKIPAIVMAIFVEDFLDDLLISIGETIIRDVFGKQPDLSITNRR